MASAKRQDEFDVDFDDTSSFVSWRFSNMMSTIADALTREEQLVVQEHRTWQDLITEIRKKIMDPKSSQTLKGLMSSIQPIPRSIATLNGAFISALSPHNVQFDFLWGMVYLNLKLSYPSTEKLRRTTEWFGRLRRVVELFNRCLDVCDDLNEPRLAMIDVYDHTFAMLGDSLKYLRDYSTDEEAIKAWPQLNSQLSTHLAELDATVKHLNDITSYSAVNLERQVKNMSLRHAPVPEAEEHANFPCTKLPFQQNDNFFGRETEMEKIISHLSPQEGNSEGPQLRTYTIFGRRGVGKTEIALQYAHENPSRFDAIFWIQCETSVSLRQSFTDVAVALNLPGADRNGHHEENLLAVQKWLKLTRRRWLLIFDNAERESILTGYWPVGAKGSILITSRKYYNFMKDIHRRGDTVKPFNEQQSYELLMLLLGEEWQSLHKRGLIRLSEVNAAKTLLKKIGGLALAINQAAILINNPDIGGAKIAGALELFNSNAQRLPERPNVERNEMQHALDTLWSMMFSVLTPNAKDLLSVLAMLSPDSMLIDLFLPRKQNSLNGKLSFLKHPNRGFLDNSHSTVTAIIKPPRALESALDELLTRGLIRRDNRVISVHRVFQEAMNDHCIEELQESFDAAVQLVYEAFPKAWTGDSMHKEWATAQAYITHGVHICMKYADFTKPSSQAVLKPSDTFTALLANCAWYLYEIGDYTTCLKLVEIASAACDDKNSARYANLRNTAGACYFDLNRLQDCRRDWEIALSIQEKQFDHDDIKVGYMVHNMGNLETGCGKNQEAIDYFTRAVNIRVALGDSAAGQLALTYLCIGRLYYFQGKYEEAMKTLATSEALFVRTAGAETHFMAYVHFAYGNIEFALEHWRSAKRSYSDALKIALTETPIHFITSAIYYSLGCVEFAMGNDEVAKGYLDKARGIAELRSPSRDDGTIARILFKTAKVLENDLLAGVEAAALRNRADVARRTLYGLGEGHIVQVLDEDGNVDYDEEDDAYDALVPIFFR